MYIILKNADFSAISIGQANIPVDITTWTEDVVSRYPNYSWTSDSIQAVERFHLSLVNNNILDNIEYLAMPIFATTLEEATQDALGGTATVTIPADASARYTVTTGKGIARTANVTAYTDAITVSQPDRTGQKPFGYDGHLMAYPLDTVASAETYTLTTYASENPDVTSSQYASYMQTWGYGLGVHSFAVGAGLSQSVSHIYTAIYAGASTNRIYVDTNYSKLAEPAVASFYNSTVYISQAEQNYISTTATASSYYDSTIEYTGNNLSLFIGLSPIIADGVWSARNFGFLSYGKHLTDEQSIAYQQALKALVDNIN